MPVTNSLPFDTYEDVPTPVVEQPAIASISRGRLSGSHPAFRRKSLNNGNLRVFLNKSDSFILGLVKVK